MAKESHTHTNISVTDNWQKIIKAQNYGGAAIRQTSKDQRKHPRRNDRSILFKKFTAVGAGRHPLPSANQTLYTERKGSEQATFSQESTAVATRKTTRQTREVQMGVCAHNGQMAGWASQQSRQRCASSVKKPNTAPRRWWGRGQDRKGEKKCQ